MVHVMGCVETDKILDAEEYCCDAESPWNIGYATDPGTVRVVYHAHSVKVGPEGGRCGHSCVNCFVHSVQYPFNFDSVH